MAENEKLEQTAQTASDKADRTGKGNGSWDSDRVLPRLFNIPQSPFRQR